MRAPMLITAAAAAILAGQAGVATAQPRVAAPAATPPARAAEAVKAGVDAWSRGDYAAAIARWRGPAEAGDADAQFNLAQAYKLGRGVARDLARAQDLYGRAARQGHAQAADNYGLVLFQNGRQSEAMEWLKGSAERGEPRAMYILGIAHFNGDYAGKDWVRAYALMNRAAASGLPQARQSLSMMDTMVPLEQRQLGVSLAGELERQAQAARSRQLAAADLGTTVPVPARAPASAARPAPASAPAPAPGPIRATPAPGPIATTTVPPSTVARSAVTGAPLDGPATAGADYADPVPVPVPTPRRVAAAPKPAPAATPAPASAPVSQSAPKASGTWRIQLGAFGQKANADALWNKVRARPELAGHARLDAGGGGVTRLQAGGFTSEAAAGKACAALKAGGTACLVVKP